MMTKIYDIVIIGSGLGGLLCGAILSKNGFNVCILEKNGKIGGCLDSYRKDGELFETGVHYIGGLDKGQNLYQIFKYVGILNKLNLERLDMDKFDVFRFRNDSNQYAFAQTYPKFIESLSAQFPHERNGIIKYCDLVKNISSQFPLYNLKNGDFFNKLEILDSNARDVINNCVNDKLLQHILAGNNSLYAGVAEKTPFYIHALIINSYIESSWRCKGGGSKIAKSLTEIIKENGGEIFTNIEVTKIVTEGKTASHVVSTNQQLFYAKTFISNLHPSITISITESEIFRKAYKNRINSLENTMGAFVLNVCFKPNTFPFYNSNFYNFAKPDVWEGVNYLPNEWPTSYALFLNSKDNKFSNSATILSYLHFSEVEKWQHTCNTLYKPSDRGSDYEQFKLLKAQKLINFTEENYPGFENSIDTFHTATPLTFRDYTGTPNGSLYGVLRDYREPLKTFIPTRTKITNLFLTGQNLNVHGVLGVSVSSLITCGELLGIEDLLEKIRNA